MRVQSSIETHDRDCVSLLTRLETLRACAIKTLCGIEIVCQWRHTIETLCARAIVNRDTQQRLCVSIDTPRDIACVCRHSVSLYPSVSVSLYPHTPNRVICQNELNF